MPVPGTAAISPLFYEGATMSALLYPDRAGRQRSPATMPGYHVRRAPANKGRHYPADPPRVEEIVAVVRQAGETVYGDRLPPMPLTEPRSRREPSSNRSNFR
jgi:hypothetical protein